MQLNVVIQRFPLMVVMLSHVPDSIGISLEKIMKQAIIIIKYGST